MLFCPRSFSLDANSYASLNAYAFFNTSLVKIRLIRAYHCGFYVFGSHYAKITPEHDISNTKYCTVRNDTRTLIPYEKRFKSVEAVLLFYC